LDNSLSESKRNCSTAMGVFRHLSKMASSYTFPPGKKN
jgi:hypothetical protein